MDILIATVSIILILYVYDCRKSIYCSFKGVLK